MTHSNKMATAIAALAIATFLAACGGGGGGGGSSVIPGGGGGSTPTPAATPTLSPQTQSTSAPASTTGTTPITFGGVSNGSANVVSSATLTLPAVNTASNATVAFSATAPNGVTTPQARSVQLKRPDTLGVPTTALGYFSITFSNTVTISSTPAFNVAFPSAVSGNCYVVVYDPTGHLGSGTGWQEVLGPISGASSLAFSAQTLAPPITLTGGVTYVFAVVTTSSVIPTPTPTPTPTATATATPTTAPTATPSTVYPAFSPPWPTVLAGTTPAPVIANPRAVPIFFSNTPDQTNMLSFLQKLGASSEWAVLSQYGVGAISVASPVMINQTAPTTLTPQQIDAFVAANADSWASYNSSQIFMLFYPSASNAPYAGWHTQTTTTPGGHKVTYVVDSGYQNAAGGYLELHELAEAATDPNGTAGYSALSRDQIAWRALSTNGTELADFCDGSPTYFASDLLGYQMHNIWSNSALGAGKDPCGSLGSVIGFGAFPVMSDSYDTNDSEVKIAPGASVTIPVKLFSYGPLGGPMTLSVSQVNKNGPGTNALQFSFDKTAGNNGDIVHLTITAPAAAFSTTTNYGVFEITATDTNSDTEIFPGLVGN